MAKITSTTTSKPTGVRRGRPPGVKNGEGKGKNKRKIADRRAFSDHDKLLQAAGLMTARDAIDAQLSALLNSVKS